MHLAFGVFATIIKRCSVDLDNQDTVSMLVHSIDANERFGEKAAKSVASRLLSCKSDFPLPYQYRDREPVTSIMELAPKIESRKDIYPHFEMIVKEKISKEKWYDIIYALKAIISEDPWAHDACKETFIDTVGMTASEFVSCQSFDLPEILAGLFLYTILIRDNIIGQETYAVVSSYSFWDDLSKSFIAFEIKAKVLKSILQLNGLSEYFSNMKNRFGKVTSILPGHVVFDFYDIFVCNVIEMPRNGRQKGKPTKDPTVESLREFDTHLILRAYGGNGKTMMFRHLLFDAINRAKVIDKVPLLVYLRHYAAPKDGVPLTENLSSYIVEQIKPFWPQFDERILKAMLHSQKVILLLDGLDEVADNAFEKFRDDLRAFIEIYPKIQIVLSARPYAQWINVISGFSIAELCPFTKDQAIELVDKISCFPIYPSRSKEFRNLIVHDQLTPTQMEFIGNPLLLTAMLMVYERKSRIPRSKAEFFETIYFILSEEHDSLKERYLRTYATGLDRKDLRKYLAEFAYNAYINQDWTLTKQRCEQIYADLACRTDEVDPTRCEDFMTDVVKNLSIMYEEGGVYNFYQHTFQEYFCAFHLAFISAGLMKKLIPKFEKSRDRVLGDSMFGMMYDINTNQVEETILLPALRNALKKNKEAEVYVCGRKGLTRKQSDLLIGYWSYVLNQYPEIEFKKYYNRDEGIEINPKSLFVEFVLHDTKVEVLKNGEKKRESIFHDDLIPSDFPDDPLVIRETFYECDGREYGTIDGKDMLVKLRDNRGDLKKVYDDIEIDVERLLRSSLADPPTLQYMESTEFPLMKEYLALVDRVDKIKQKRRKNNKAVKRKSGQTVPNAV